MNIKKSLKIIIQMVLILYGLTSAVWAEDSAVNFGNRKFSEDDVINVFTSPGAEQSNTPKNRSISPKMSAARALSVEIYFELDSYQLTPDACEALNVMGNAFNNNRIKDAVFVIEGHTDASGSTAYNKRLSEQRARSVRDYLVYKANVSPERLKTIGKGESELLFSNRPYAPENRRVKFIMKENQ